MSLLFDTALFLRSNPRQCNLNSNQKLILMILASHIGSNEQWIIKRTELAKECGMCLTVFKDNLRVLIANKIIIIGKIITKEGWQSAYKINKEVIHNSRKSGQPYQEGMVVNPADPPLPLVGLPADPLGGIPANPPPTPNPEAQLARGLQDIAFSPNGTKAIEHKDNRKRKEEIVALPTWLPYEQWEDFLSHRKCLKAPMGSVAQKRGIMALQKFKDAGQDVLAIIDQSIVNGWKGFFPIRKQYGDMTDGQQRLTRAQASVKTYLDRLKQEDRAERERATRQAKMVEVVVSPVFGQLQDPLDRPPYGF